MTNTIRLKAFLLALLLVGLFSIDWHFHVSVTAADHGIDAESAGMMRAASKDGSNVPGPLDVCRAMPRVTQAA